MAADPSAAKGKGKAAAAPGQDSSFVAALAQAMHLPASVWLPPVVFLYATTSGDENGLEFWGTIAAVYAVLVVCNFLNTKLTAKWTARMDARSSSKGGKGNKAKKN